MHTSATGLKYSLSSLVLYKRRRNHYNHSTINLPEAGALHLLLALVDVRDFLALVEVRLLLGVHTCGKENDDEFVVVSNMISSPISIRSRTGPQA